MRGPLGCTTPTPETCEMVQGILTSARNVSQMAFRNRVAFADALHAMSKTRNLLVIASTDMLHDADYERVTRTDRVTLDLVERMDREALRERWSSTNQSFCGICPVLTAMDYAEKQGCREAAVLHYRNSGDDFPESRGNWVVGYGAVVFDAKSDPSPVDQ